MTKFVLIEPCNFVDFPIGGQLSFARQLMEAFGNEITLVGYAHKDEPVGKWYKKTIDSVEYDYFGIHYIENTDSKPFIPLRIQNLVWFLIHIKKILNYQNDFWFIQAPEILIIATKFKHSGISYMFPGVTNPLDIPRYKWGVLFANSFYNRFLKSLQKTDLRLACADEASIIDLKQRGGQYINDLDIIHFPTRFDSQTFHPISIGLAREKINIPKDKFVIVCCGRISEVKGWQLVFDAYREFHKQHINSLLIFVGDGEDKEELLQKISHHKLLDNIMITGFQSPENVANYLNSCNLVVVGSIREGWSVGMLEALACGKTIVSTSVSGASTLIKQGENGFIVDNRDPKEFAYKMSETLTLDHPDKISLSIAKEYPISTLKRDLLNMWTQISS